MKLPDTMKKMGGGKLAFALLALFPFASGAATYYASPDGTGSGTYESPYSLSAGINKVKTYAHTLILKPGRYLLSSPIAFNGTGSGTPTKVLGETGNPADVILDAQFACEAMRLNRNVLVAGITIMNGNNANASLDTRSAGVRVGYSANLDTLSVVSNCVITCCSNAFTSSSKTSGTVIYGGAVCVYDSGLLVDSYVTNNTAAYRSGGVVFKNGVVRGCTISGNSGPEGGGGVFCERSSSGVLADSTISGNTATNGGGGGGVSCYLDGSSLVITNCTIVGNASGFGGGLDVWSAATVTCLDCRFEQNEATTIGGGMRVTGEAKGVFSGCIFDGNRSTGSNDHGGGGCVVYGQSGDGFASLSNCVFRNNYSSTRGGALSGGWNKNMRAELVGCVITNNSSERQGAGVMIRDSQAVSDCSAVLRNCLVAFNHANAEGGGVYFVATNAVLDSCTIVSNRVKSTSNGAGLYHRWGGAVTNCVIAFNMKGTTLNTGSYWCLNGNSTADPSVYRNCCVWPAVSDVFLAENGCVNADPLFADPDHGDFTLLPNSPCRNAGMLEDWMEGAADLAGGPRVSGRGVDMGCYELFAPSGLNIIVR